MSQLCRLRLQHRSQSAKGGIHWGCGFAYSMQAVLLSALLCHFVGRLRFGGMVLCGCLLAKAKE